MADESEVEQALVDLIDADLFPNGPHGPSTVCWGTKIYAGWPISADLERETKDGLVHVSVYAVPGTTSDVGQPFIDTTATLCEPTLGLDTAVEGRTITITGKPTPGEYVTAIVGQRGYSYLARFDDTPDKVATGLAALLVVDYPATTASGASVTLPAEGPDLSVRGGAPAEVGERIHRQRQQFRVVVWASLPEARSNVAKRVDLCLKRNLKIVLPDGTMALVNSMGSNPSDLYQLDGIYRRDLLLAITYDTLDAYPAYPVTHVQIADDPDIFR